MRSYILYKDKSVKGFRKLLNAGGGIFDKYRTLATAFMRYAYSDLDDNLANYDAELDINSIKLEMVFPQKYRWFISDVSLRNSRKYIESINSRITEFQGKEDNLKIMVGVLFLKFVLITKIVETYCSTLVNLKKAGLEYKNLGLDDIGINNQILKHYLEFEELGEKSIDDWLKLNIDQSTAKLFYSSMRRILKILLAVDEK